MDVGRYCSNVRMGNWNEELFLEEEKLKIFLKKQENGELLVQKARRLFVNLLRETTLAIAVDFLQFGSVMQLVAPDVVSRGSSSERRGLALSGLVSEKQVDYSQHLTDGCTLTASPFLEPVVRNSFVIRSADTKQRDGEPLKFGQSFFICPYETANNVPLYVESEVPQIDTVLGPSGHASLRLVKRPNAYCRWRVLYWDPSLRPETEGAPFPPNCRVVINHCSSNKNLAIENKCWYQTYFGMECEVAVHIYLDIYKREAAENMWMFVTQRADTQTPAKATVSKTCPN